MRVTPYGFLCVLELLWSACVGLIGCSSAWSSMATSSQSGDLSIICGVSNRVKLAAFRFSETERNEAVMKLGWSLAHVLPPWLCLLKSAYPSAGGGSSSAVFGLF
ncbi:hypothetical protein Rs2_48699 [Raphanus sativus]|nr:hypothetical protein Rs2_48699 [Raphanus sativus]